MSDKQTNKSTPKKPAKPKKCLRQIDASTQLMSDDPSFPPVLSPKSEPLPKGHVRVDDSTVVKGELGKPQAKVAPGAKKTAKKK